MVPAARAPVPDSRRLADGLPPAARLAAVGGARRVPTPSIRARSVGAGAASASAVPPAALDSAAARCARSTTRARQVLAADRRVLAQPRRRARRVGAVASCAPRCASSRATAGCTSSCRRSRTSKTTSTWSPRSRRRRASLDMPVHRRRRTPPHDPRLESHQGDARPRRDRGEHAPGAQLGRARRHHRRRSTKRRASRGCGTEKFMLDGRHTGTGGGNHVVARRADAGRQPVPAPARPAAQPRRATGTTTRRCRTCSPACSSVRRARQPRVDEARHDSLYELEIAFAADRRAADAAHRRGWSIGCSATCWST